MSGDQKPAEPTISADANEVPTALKQLVRCVTRAFYTKESWMIMDYLVKYHSLKEDDLAELLRYDRKQLRQYMNTLSRAKFVKIRLKVETDADGRAAKKNFYFVDYRTVLNVLKYKLDHMRKRIDQEEKNSQGRASYKCPACAAAFTDFEVGHLLDRITGDLLCSFCRTPVEEDASAAPRKDARQLLIMYNAQLAPVFALLKQCEQINLSQHLLEPQPVDLSRIIGSGAAASAAVDDRAAPADADQWRTGKNFSLPTSRLDTRIEIHLGDEEPTDQVDRRKERPVWMVESTVDSTLSENYSAPTAPKLARIDTALPKLDTAADSDDIMHTLLIYERKSASMPNFHDSAAPQSFSPARSPVAEHDVTDVVEPSVRVAGQLVPLSQVADEHVARMTAAEKQEYIRVGQQMYADMYD